MKKNILGAIVIFFVTFACLLALNEISSDNAPEFEAQYYVED